MGRLGRCPLDSCHGSAATALRRAAWTRRRRRSAAPCHRETVAPVFSYPIAGVAGKSLTALTVSYAPGAKTPAHRHGRAFVVGYVLEGAIRSRLGNGETKVYKAGESWSEAPGAHHTVSENASDTEPAKILALFVAKTDAKDLGTIDGQPGKSKK